MSDMSKMSVAELNEWCTSIDRSEGYMEIALRRERAMAELARRLAERDAEIVTMSGSLNAVEDMLAGARARDKAAENLWVPISEHPQEWEDGESYLLRVPVCILRPWGAREKTYEFHIVTAKCDDDEPVSFLAANGDPWDLWYWEDADYFIRMEMLSDPCARKDTKGEVQP